MVCRHCGCRCELVDAEKHWRQLEVGAIAMRVVVEPRPDEVQLWQEARES